MNFFFGILILYGLSAVTALGKTEYQYYTSNLFILSPADCALLNITCPLDDRPCCPTLHDGLSCWVAGFTHYTPTNSLLDIYNESKDYMPVYQLCPTITNQVTPKTMRKYCSKTGQWVNPATMQPDEDYIEDADCYLNGQSPNLEERNKLSALTQELKYTAMTCELRKLLSESNPALQFQYGLALEPELVRVRDSNFDGVMCTITNGQDSFCPPKKDFYTRNFMSNSQITKFDEDNHIIEEEANITTEAEYGLGWSMCLRDDYKQLLTKYGLDQYFRQGCAPFKNNYVDLPFTKVNQSASSPCNRIVSQNSRKLPLEEFPMLDLTKQGSFYCNAQRQWEGYQEPELNKGCYKTEFRDKVTELQDFVRDSVLDACPVIKDKLVGEWRETRAGQNATASCQPLYDLFTQLNGRRKSDSEIHVRNARTSSEQTLKRFCGSDGKWAKVNYFDCFEYSERDRDVLRDKLKQYSDTRE